MKLKKLAWMICLVIAVATCAGCSKEKAKTRGSQDMGTTEGVLEPKFEKAGKVEESTLGFDSVAIAVGKEEVTFREILAYIYMLKSNYEPEFGSEIWNYDMPEHTFGRMALEETVHMAIQMKIIQKEAKKIPLALSPSEADEWNVKAENYLTRIAPEDVRQYGLTAEVLSTIFCDNELARRMHDICINQVNTQISDEDAKQITVQYLLIMTNGINKNGIQISSDDKAKSESHQKAKDLLKKAKKVESFYSFADSNTDATVVEQTIGRDKMSKEFTEAAFQLKPDSCSDIVEAPEGYYIIYCVSDYEEDATKQEKERIILEEQNRVFERQYEDWVRKYQVNISKLLWDYDYYY